MPKNAKLRGRKLPACGQHVSSVFVHAKKVEVKWAAAQLMLHLPCIIVYGKLVWICNVSSWCVYIYWVQGWAVSVVCGGSVRLLFFLWDKYVDDTLVVPADRAQRPYRYAERLARSLWHNQENPTGGGGATQIHTKAPLAGASATHT